MKRYFLFCLTFILTANLSAQTTTGFFGKRFLIEGSGSGYFALFSKFDRYFDHSLDLAHDGFDPGFKAQVSYVINDRFMLGFELAQHAVNVVGPRWYRGNYNNVSPTFIVHEQLGTIARDYNLKFEIGSQGNLFPSGLSHQFGVGYSTMRIVNKDYTYQFLLPQEVTNIQAASAEVEATISEYAKNAIKGFNLFYEIHMRTPITKWLLLSYGYRVNLFVMERAYINNVLSYDSGYPLQSAMRERRMKNFSSANIGLAFIF